MTLSIKDRFAKAGAYIGFYTDVISIIPSERVKAQLKEQGYRFEASDYIEAIIHAPTHPGAVGSGLPLEVVVTEAGTNVYRSGDAETINRYEEDKRKAAASIRGFTTPPSISNYFKYQAAVLLAQDGPPKAVRQDLMKKGWQFRPSMTEKEARDHIIAGSMAGGPAAAVPFMTTRVFSPEGEQVFKLKDRNPELEARYMAEVRASAAKLYPH